MRAHSLSIDTDLRLIIHGLKHQPHSLVSPVLGLGEDEGPRVGHRVLCPQPGHHTWQGWLHTEGHQDLLRLSPVKIDEWWVINTLSCYPLIWRSQRPLRLIQCCLTIWGRGYSGWGSLGVTWLVNTSHVTWILASDWSPGQPTWSSGAQSGGSRQLTSWGSLAPESFVLRRIVFEKSQGWTGWCKIIEILVVLISTCKNISLWLYMLLKMKRLRKMYV